VIGLGLRAPNRRWRRLQPECLTRAEMELLLELEPGLLVRHRKAADVEEFLRESSADSGVLFFQERLYHPRLPGFVEYCSSSELS